MAIVHFISKRSTIETRKYLDHNEYRGTPAELIAAGIITRDQLPGQPGRNKTTVTINGRKGRSPGPNYLQIRLISKTAVVKVGIPAAERVQRLAEHKAKEERVRKSKTADVLSFQKNI